MNINWQTAIVPTGMPFNPSDLSFTNELFNFLIPLEAPALSQRLNLTLVPQAKNKNVFDLTIGVGFDLRTGGSFVQNAVFAELGLATSVEQQPNSSPQAQEEYAYIQQLQSDVSLGTQAALDDMNQVMADRLKQYNSDPAFKQFIDGAMPGATQHGSFALLSDNEVYAVFSQLWSTYYEPQIFSVFPSLQGTSFQDSREEEALADLIWNGGKGLLGPGLQQAINSGNRAEAWFQIRYRSNRSGDPVQAERRYYESQVFGLYDNASAVAPDEALQAYQMLSANRAAIVQYELTFGTNPYSPSASVPSGEIDKANQGYELDGTSGQVQTLAQAFDPAAQAERQYLDGLYSNVMPDIEINDAGGTIENCVNG